MGNIKERVAYLQGLTQGLNVNERSAEGKLLINIIDVLDDMAEEFNNIQMVQEDLETYVESMDDDLTDLEDEVYEDIDNEELVEVQCPSCHETVSFESSLLESDDDLEVSCPHCGDIVYDSTLEIEVSDNGNRQVNSDFRYGIHPGI
ncbi:CD1247 N-terminal domain-containing protein [Pelosinus baikalensis]|uniref:AraC family transcriptional regulator n=1 Tax=Pelosinus baikalensis TaxID=2892015 RepID=A0ABS8HMB4_9FIRM|nr:CD1247 N-terminal domain-containing protein [Pelosinus baikalensis]MCC5464326.1 AraC family transcriptional regulator [Pelosinus baikalensis]